MRGGRLVAAIRIAFAGASCAAETAPDYEPRFRQTRCLLGADPHTTCGYLDVPESRSNPDGRQVSLFVERLTARDAERAQPDAVLVLAGGPGGVPYATELEDALRAQRDVVLLHQRGSGLSEPELQCAELHEYYARASLELDAADPQRIQIGRDATAACRKRLLARGIDPAAYDVASSAADVEDLRRALGIERWNLEGTSYGTRLALEVLRRYPDSVRSAVLAGVLPAQVDYWTELAANAARARDRLFELCAADPACPAPNPQQVFSTLVAELEATPETFTFERDGAPAHVRLDGDLLASIVNGWLYETAAIAAIPQWLVDMQSPGVREDYALAVLESAGADDLSIGLFLSVMCRSFPSAADPAARQQCEAWNVGSAPASERQAVHAAAPVLLVAGELDPVTPPAWAHLAAKTLPNAYVVEVAAAGHDAIYLECVRDLVRAFVADPSAEPADDCGDLPPLNFGAP